MDKDTYCRTIKRQVRDGNPAIACHVCGEDDPQVIESHHPFGRNNSEETIPFCKNHHAKITAEQNKVSPIARSSSATPNQKLGYALISIGTLLEVDGRFLKNLGHEVIERG